MKMFRSRQLELIAVTAVVCLFSHCQSFSLLPSGRKHQQQRGSNTIRSVRSTASALSSSVLSATSLKASSSSPQVLEFQEPTTGVTVKLVGCMHYNPASIQTTEDVISDLAQDNKLGSVIIESCDIRWNQTQTLPLAIQKLLQSEMKAACELASETYQRPVVLGDQRINITVSSLKRGFQETFMDLATPWNGGWGRLFSNVTLAREEAVPFGDQYLNAFAFLDPKLLLAAPVSLIKYPLSYFFKSPIRTTVALTLLFLLDRPPSDAATLVTMDQMTAGDWVGSLAVSGVEIALFARVFLKELLAERNEILARNILEQCKLYQSSDKKPTKFSFGDFFGSNNRNEKVALEEVIYVEGPTNPGVGKDKAVVAVLGMAHCNGIAKLLQEQKV